MRTKHTLSVFGKYNGNIPDFTEKNTYPENSTCDFQLASVFSALRLDR